MYVKPVFMALFIRRGELEKLLVLYSAKKPIKSFNFAAYKTLVTLRKQTIWHYLIF